MTPPAEQPTRSATMTGARARPCVWLCAATLMAAPAAAQDAGPYGLPDYDTAAPKNLTLLSIPSATVAPHGLGFASLGLTSRRGGTLHDWDGSLALGLGLGDADQALGVQVTANVTSLTDNFGDSGYFQIKLARRILDSEEPIYLAVEAEGLARWGQAANTPQRNRIMATWFPVLWTAEDAYPLMVTLGYGSHLRNRRTDPAVFAGAGIGLNRNLGVSAAWTGQTLDLGASWRFDGMDGMVVNAEFNDATDRLGSQRFSISFNFFNPNLFRR